MTDQTTTTVGSRAGMTGPPRHGQGPSPRDLAARAPARDAPPSPGPRRPGDELAAAAAGNDDGCPGAGGSAGTTRRRRRLRHPRGGHPPPLRPAVRLPQGAPHPGKARAGRRPRGGWLRPGDRASRGVHRHVGAGRDQPGHPARRRVHGLGARGRHHRAGAVQPDRHRRFPGGGHRGDHAAGHQAQLPRHRGRRHRQDGGRGIPRGRDRPARPGAGGRREGRAAGQDAVPLAGAVRPAWLPPGDPAALPPGARGGPDDDGGRSARCSTSAAA